MPCGTLGRRVLKLRIPGDGCLTEVSRAFLMEVPWTRDAQRLCPDEDELRDEFHPRFATETGSFHLWCLRFCCLLFGSCLVFGLLVLLVVLRCLLVFSSFSHVSFMHVDCQYP